jgi:glycosyltransferase involved in cell wall biosynthesis
LSLQTVIAANGYRSKPGGKGRLQRACRRSWAQTGRRLRPGPRKIVVLTSSFPRFEGDFAGRFVADAVVHLRARGLEVAVVHPTRPADGGGLVRLLTRRPWLVVSLFTSLVVQLRRAARDADLVHTHWLASALIARFARRPFVVTLHGTGSAGPLSDLSLAAHAPWLVRFLLRPARSVICVSSSLTETMRSIGVEQARWIPNGVELPHPPRRDARGRFVLYAGRLSPEKGIAELVEATRSLPLVVAGDGPLRSLVPDTLGFVPNHELARLYDQAAVVVFPSRREGLPVALLEAMAHACPIVATDVGGIPQLIEHGQTGLLVPPRDPNALRTAIERLLAEPALARRLGQAARTTVSSLCEWERITTATLDAYDPDPAPLLAHSSPSRPAEPELLSGTSIAVPEQTA